MTINWNLSTESQLKAESDVETKNWWQTHVKTNVMVGKDKAKIAYAWTVPKTPKAAVLLVNGRVETYLKYREVIAELLSNDVAVFTFDHRGQGLSDRISQDPQKGFVKAFSDYVEDLHQFIHHIVRPIWSAPLSMLCHSMGGAVGTLALLADPSPFDKAVLCSPMFGIKPALPNWIAAPLLNAGLAKTQLKGVDCDYFFGQKAYTAYPYSINQLTHSQTRYGMMVDLYTQNPEIQLGGVTTEWLVTAQAAMNEIEQRATEITIPTLVLSAGKDRIIDNQRQERVVRQFANGSFVQIPGAYHELFNERDDYRIPAMTACLEFIHA